MIYDLRYMPDRVECLPSRNETYAANSFLTFLSYLEFQMKLSTLVSALTLSAIATVSFAADLAKLPAAVATPKAAVATMQSLMDPATSIALIQSSIDPAFYTKMGQSAMDPKTVGAYMVFADPALATQWMAASMDPNFAMSMVTPMMNPNTYVKWMSAPMDPRVLNLGSQLINPSLYT
ncbi:MAG: hypothetical protein D4R70_02510, partial [Betaproteobacteria bacterium]